MYAIVETGGKQYKVKEKDTVDVELLSTRSAHKVTLNKVLLISDKGHVTVGNPTIKGAQVHCEKVATIKSKKKVIFKYIKRKASDKKTGHRQNLLRLRVEKIELKE